MSPDREMLILRVAGMGLSADGTFNQLTRLFGEDYAERLFARAVTVLELTQRYLTRRRERNLRECDSQNYNARLARIIALFNKELNKIDLQEEDMRNGEVVLYHAAALDRSLATRERRLQIVLRKRYKYNPTP